MKSKLAKIIAVCAIAIMLLVVVTVLPLTVTPEPMLRTGSCEFHTVRSLVAHGEVRRTEAGFSSRRGFVFMEGTTGEPSLNISSVVIVNDSFEDGDPPTGWSFYQSGVSGEYSRSTEQAKVGAHSLKAVSYDNKNAIITQARPDREQYIGKRVTVGLWVWSDNRADVMIRWGGFWDVTSSGTHPGDSQWRWMTVSRTIQETDTALTVKLRAGSGETLATTAYFDKVVVVVGDAVFEDGEFGRGEYSLVIKGLKPDTSYRVRAFAVNEVGVGYGNTVTASTAAD